MNIGDWTTIQSKKRTRSNGQRGVVTALEGKYIRVDLESGNSYLFLPSELEATAAPPPRTPLSAWGEQRVRRRQDSQ